jgi:hypothetical protein
VLSVVFSRTSAFAKLGDSTEEYHVFLTSVWGWGRGEGTVTESARNFNILVTHGARY